MFHWGSSRTATHDDSANSDHAQWIEIPWPCLRYNSQKWVTTNRNWSGKVVGTWNGNHHRILTQWSNELYTQRSDRSQPQHIHIHLLPTRQHVERPHQ